MKHKFIAEYFELKEGVYPAKDFLDSLEPKLRAKTKRAIDRLQDEGNALIGTETEHLDGPIFQVRAVFGNNISRILFFFYDEGKIILTHGFVKKTKKTPPPEIERAKKYRAIYLDRKQNKKED